MVVVLVLLVLLPRFLQVITHHEHCRPENRLSTLTLDSGNSTIMCCSSIINSWAPVDRMGEVASMEHKHPIAAALYNPIFRQVISGDTCGYVSVWDINTGKLNFRSR